MEDLLELSSLLAHWAERVNLTAYRGSEQIARRLILDAAALLAMLPEFASLADLGSGAGFPGIPIAILRPETRVTLVEAREKRHHFQRSAIRALGLANAKPLRGRIEELPPIEHSAVVAQAVGPPHVVVGWMSRWAREDGWLILPASQNFSAQPPLEQARDFRLLEYQVPLGGPSRRIWLARRAVASGHP